MRRRLHTPKEIFPAGALSAAIELRGDLDPAAEADLEWRVVRAVAGGATEIRIDLTEVTNVIDCRERVLTSLTTRVRELDSRVRIVDVTSDPAHTED